MSIKNSTLILIAILAMSLSSCSVSSRSMKTPNYHIEFYKSDFAYSPQVTAEATSVKVFCIDWKRLFSWKTGHISSDRFDAQPQSLDISANVFTEIGNFAVIIPVVGEYLKSRVSAYALYNLMQDNPGYDLVIYPQFESKSFVFPFIYSKRTVKVTARLGKIE